MRARTSTTAGHSLYLVGGSVRDAIVSEPDAGVPDGAGGDLDFSTDARPDAIEAVVSAVDADNIYQIRNGSGVGVFAPQYGARVGYFVGVTKSF